MKRYSANKEIYRPPVLSYIMKILTNITIEPAMFMLAFADGLDDVSLSQMIIEKTCRVDFDFNQTVCDNLVNNYTKENDMVQDEVRIFEPRKLRKLRSNFVFIGDFP